MIASDTGGNYELICKDYIFPCGDFKALASIIQKMIPNCAEAAKFNFEHSKHFDAERLENLRNQFLTDFIKLKC